MWWLLHKLDAIHIDRHDFIDLAVEILFIAAVQQPLRQHFTQTARNQKAHEFRVVFSQAPHRNAAVEHDLDRSLDQLLEPDRLRADLGVRIHGRQQQYHDLAALPK